MKVSKSASREAAMRKAITRLNKCLRSATRKQVLLMLSGGSSLELAAGIDMRHIGKHITIAALDERYSRDPAVNNFSQITETEFCKKAERKGVDYIDTRINRRISLYGLAGKFERGLKSWKKKHPAGRVIITQGIGEDGHTAGILPYPENPKRFAQLFERPSRWAVGYNATKGKNKYLRRVTVTFPFLWEQVDCAVVYATGSKKRKALRRVFAEKGNLAKTPARVIRQMKNVFLFTDIS
ncbi:MAG: 6-phosphogluconolactonase [Candidatus Wildermuthbacteria bacterium]|nr:6-phosphogluconolactonase [Candidatus Wildermuthbacteria bacterium]